MAAQFKTVKPSLDALSLAPVKFRFVLSTGKTRTLLVDSLTANAILTVYKNVNEANQAKIKSFMDSGHLGKFALIQKIAFNNVSF